MLAPTPAVICRYYNAFTGVSRPVWTFLAVTTAALTTAVVFAVSVLPLAVFLLAGCVYIIAVTMSTVAAGVYAKFAMQLEDLILVAAGVEIILPDVLYSL